MREKIRLIVHEDEGLRVPDICGTAIELINRRTSDPKNVSFALVQLEPGAESQAHHHLETEEIYFILEGQGVVIVDSVELKIQPGHAVLLPIKSIHRIKNTGSTVLKIACSDSPPFDPIDVYID